MRHLPAGEISVSSARWFTAACSVGFILCTLLFLPNWLPLLFSVPVLCFLCGYSLAKRFTYARTPGWELHSVSHRYAYGWLSEVRHPPWFGMIGGHRWCLLWGLRRG